MVRAYEARARLCLPVGARRQTPYGARRRYRVAAGFAVGPRRGNGQCRQGRSTVARTQQQDARSTLLLLVSRYLTRHT